MKKTFLCTLLGLLCSIGMTWAKDLTIALSDFTETDGTYEYTFSSAGHKLNQYKDGLIYVEVPSASVSGTVAWKANGTNTSRNLYIYKTNGTVKDESRALNYVAGWVSVLYTSGDILTNGEHYYLVFNTKDDWKADGVKYTAAAPDHTKATVNSILIDDAPLNGFNAASLVYNIELDYGTTDIPVVSAVTGDDASVIITQAAALPGSATVACTSQDGNASVTYTINFSVISTPSSDATLKTISLDGKALAGFDAETIEYTVELEYDATAAPTIAAEGNERHANVVINQAAAIPGDATVVVTAQDGTSSKTYTIHFMVEELIPIIRAKHTGSSTATVSGSIGGTADKDTQNDGKLGNNGHYFGIRLAEGSFQEGDSLVIVATLNGGNTATLFKEKAGTNAIASVDFDVNTGICSYVLTEADSAIYIVRKSSGCNPTISKIQVYRPVDDGQPKLNVNVDEIDLNVTAENPSVSATVAFTGKHLTPGNYSLTIPNLEGLTVDPASVTVGEDGKLNAQVTVTYATTADVAAASTSFSLTIGALSKSVTVNYSATHAKSYMTGAIYIDQEVLDHGKSFDIAAALAAANITYGDIDALDSLNDDKANRNLPYLGLKLKKQGAYIAGWLQAGDTIHLRFGFVGDSIKASINGNSEFWKPTNKELSDRIFIAPVDGYMKLELVSGNTVVLKQIAINGALKDDIVLPAQTKYKVTCATAENGSVKVGTKTETYVAIGATVTLTVAPAEGYEIAGVTVNGEELAPVENVYSFVMPAEEVTVTATFTPASGSGCENVQSEVIIRKYLRGGQLVIEKDGVLYTATGQRL